jgi:hypothetical protein
LVEIKDKGKGRNNVGSTETQQEKRKKRRNAVEYATIKERKGKDGKKKEEVRANYTSLITRAMQ